MPLSPVQQLAKQLPSSEKGRLTWAGRFANIFYAIANGCLAAFTLETICNLLHFELFDWEVLGGVVAGAIFVGVFTWMIYDEDPFVKLKKSLKAFIKLDAYGHIASLLKAFVVFAAVSEIMVTFASLPLVSAPVIMTGLVFAAFTYMAQATKLLHEGRRMLGEEKEPIPARFRPKTAAGWLHLYVVKPLVVLGHTLGECAPLFMMFGFYGALNAWGLFPFLMVCLFSALFVGPTTGRFYGKPLFSTSSPLSKWQTVPKNRKGVALACTSLFFKGALGFVGGFEFLMLFHAGPLAQLLFGLYLGVSSCYAQAPRLIPKCCAFFNKREAAKAKVESRVKLETRSPADAPTPIPEGQPSVPPRRRGCLLWASHRSGVTVFPTKSASPAPRHALT